MKYHFCSLSLFFILVLNISPVAQNHRPKVGLVLSGGGAKGIAHIGILKAMEEAGLTPDFITGTSMGSIVGGLYSIGYTADELSEVVLAINWDQILSNKVPLNEVAYEEKFYYERYLLDFYLKKKEFILPSGVIDGQALIELFSKLTRSVHNIESFNDFPIPFACVGTDISTGEPVVLNNGSLAMSMRASMAIPTVFTPVEIDGKLLVDGGLVRNVPVPEIIDMGADIIIIVYVGTDLKPKEDLNSAIAILAQSALITNAFDSQEQLTKSDILIEPDLGEYSTSSFHSAPQILDLGMKAGQQYYEVFKSLADSLDQLGPVHKVVRPNKPGVYIIDSIDVAGNEIIDEEFIVGKLRIKTGEPFTIKRLEERMSLIFGTQYFSKLWYEFLKDDKKNILRIHVEERPRVQLRFAYHYDTDNKGGIIGNITLRNLVLNKSRLIFEADIGLHPTILADYFKYMGNKQDFAAGLSGFYAKTELPGYDSAGTKSHIFSNEYYGGRISLQSTMVQSSAFGIRVSFLSNNIKPKVVSDSTRFLTKIAYSSIAVSVYYRFNNYNKRYFPTKGMNAGIEYSFTPRNSGKMYFKNILLPSDFTDLFIQSKIHLLDAEISPVLQLSKKFSLLSKFRLLLSNIENNKFNLSEFHYIGGLIPPLLRGNEYLGASTKEFVLANYFYARLGLQYELRRKLYLQLHVNYINSEYPMKWLYPDVDISSMSGHTHRYGVGLVMGYYSPVGPIMVAVSKDQYFKGVKASLAIGFYY